MVRVRITQDSDSAPATPAVKRRSKKREPNRPAEPPRGSGQRGLSERQWFIGLLVVAGLLLLFTFRGCILPSGIGPKNEPGTKVTPTASPSAAPAAGGEYTVAAGDTLSGIAQKTGSTVDALAQANDINLNQRVILRVGQKLKIPQ